MPTNLCSDLIDSACRRVIFPLFLLKKVAPPRTPRLLVIFDVFVSRWQKAFSSGCLPQLLGFVHRLEGCSAQLERQTTFPFAVMPVKYKY